MTCSHECRNKLLMIARPHLLPLPHFLSGLNQTSNQVTKLLVCLQNGPKTHQVPKKLLSSGTQGVSGSLTSLASLTAIGSIQAGQNSPGREPEAKSCGAQGGTQNKPEGTGGLQGSLQSNPTGWPTYWWCPLKGSPPWEVQEGKRRKPGRIGSDSEKKQKSP